VHGDCLPSLYYMCQIKDTVIQILWSSVESSSRACVAATLTLHVCLGHVVDSALICFCLLYAFCSLAPGCTADFVAGRGHLFPLG